MKACHFIFEIKKKTTNKNPNCFQSKFQEDKSTALKTEQRAPDPWVGRGEALPETEQEQSWKLTLKFPQPKGDKKTGQLKKGARVPVCKESKEKQELQGTHRKRKSVSN